VFDASRIQARHQRPACQSRPQKLEREWLGGSQSKGELVGRTLLAACWNATAAELAKLTIDPDGFREAVCYSLRIGLDMHDGPIHLLIRGARRISCRETTRARWRPRREHLEPNQANQIQVGRLVAFFLDLVATPFHVLIEVQRSLLFQDGANSKTTTPCEYASCDYPATVRCRLGAVWFKEVPPSLTYAEHR